VHSPARTDSGLEAQVVTLRRAHPAWGGRKISRRLQDLGYIDVPAPSTVTSILHRHHLISEQASAQATPWQRFEHPEPNMLWQIDFKGYFETLAGRCHPLTVLDDCSRYNLVFTACARTNVNTVRPALTTALRRYGLPLRINADNRAPWGSSREPEHGITQLTVWLIRRGICISHSAPVHPQTNGKDERFHRSFKAEVLNGRSFNDLDHAQGAFDRWRQIYNHERPHETLQLATPITRYRPNPRAFPETLPSIEYAPNDIVTTVDWNGWVRLMGRPLKVSTALHRLPIAFRADQATDGTFDVYFCNQRFMRIDLRDFEKPV